MSKTPESLIRISVRTLYDAQKLRIQTGNRIVAAFRDKLGIAPGEAEEDSPEAKETLDTLRAEYQRITDGVKRITRRTKSDSNLLTSPGEIKMIEAYEHQLACEGAHTKLIELELQRYPIYTEWLSKVRGVGPMMAGVIISEIDIRKCEAVSGLWAICGLDTVSWFDLKERHHPDAPAILYRRHPDGYTTQGPAKTGTHTDWFELYRDGILLGRYGLPDPDSEEAKTKGYRQGRSRKAGHLVPKTYKNRDGEEIHTVGLSFNPFLKTKVVGVLADVFIKLGGPYRSIYDTYKARLEADPRHQDKTKLHRHNMAKRYMMKEFLADLHREWRTLEGLPVRPRYSAEKLAA